jgi:hypothetical protein
MAPVGPKENRSLTMGKDERAKISGVGLMCKQTHSTYNTCGNVAGGGGGGGGGGGLYSYEYSICAVLAWQPLH